MNKPILSGELTKKFFFSLLPGDYLVSNVFEATGQPIFAEIIKPKGQRESQWKAIVAARANRRRCQVFNSKKHYYLGFPRLASQDDVTDIQRRGRLNRAIFLMSHNKT